MVPGAAAVFLCHCARSGHTIPYATLAADYILDAADADSGDQRSAAHRYARWPGPGDASDAAPGGLFRALTHRRTFRNGCTARAAPSTGTPSAYLKSCGASLFGVNIRGDSWRRSRAGTGAGAGTRAGASPAPTLHPFNPHSTELDIGKRARRRRTAPPGPLSNPVRATEGGEAYKKDDAPQNHSGHLQG